MEKLVSGRHRIVEAAEHRGGHHAGILLFHPAHHHAEVLRLDHDRHTLRLEHALDGVLVKARVDQRADIQGVPYQLYSTMTVGATRLEAGRVIQIECTEA